MRGSRLAYISFDTVPAPKGAATHIQAFARTLAGAFGAVDLVSVRDGAGVSLTERWPGISHTELSATGDTLIDRVLCFRRFLAHWLRNRHFDAIQFRSIFEGLPLLELSGRTRLIFEVNGLPSIELKYRYPGVEDDRELMRKVEAQEQACLNAADMVITPSAVTRQYLISTRRVSPGKVKVIANGVDAEMFRPREPDADGVLRLLYFGTLSAWQGVELGIRALAQIRCQVPAEFTVIGAGSGSEQAALTALADRLGVGDYVHVLPAMPQAELMEHLCESDAVLAPLTLNDRNLVQGCCPLKIIEGMAAGAVVIASNLPVVRELGSDGVHFLLVKPGSVDQIAQAVLQIAADPSLANRIADQARARVLTHYTWDRSGDELVRSYEELGIKRVSNA